MTAKEMTEEEMGEAIKANLVKNAKERPWGWEFKYLSALYMLHELVEDHKGRKGRRSIKGVKELLGITYAAMMRWKLIEMHQGQLRVIHHG